MTECKPGDRVKVTFEGEVHYSDRFGFTLANGMAFVPTTNKLDNLTVEKVGETFKPGDFLKHRVTTNRCMVVEGGYVDLDELIYRESLLPFTSDNWERYDIAPVPF